MSKPNLPAQSRLSPPPAQNTPMKATAKCAKNGAGTGATRGMMVGAKKSPMKRTK